MSETDAVLKTEELPPLVLQALGYALDYLKEFHLEAVLRQSCAFRPFSRANEISLSPNALRSAIKLSGLNPPKSSSTVSDRHLQCPKRAIYIVLLAFVATSPI